MAGFTGLHNCDPEDVTSHARDVITDLVTTCLEDISDQEISVAAMTCITTLLTAPDVTNNTCLDPVYPELCTRVKSLLYTETGDTCPEQQAAALGVLQHVSLVTSGRDLEVVTICLILASSSHEITREEVVRTLTAIGEVSNMINTRTVHALNKNNVCTIQVILNATGIGPSNNRQGERIVESVSTANAVN